MGRVCEEGKAVVVEVRPNHDPTLKVLLVVYPFVSVTSFSPGFPFHCQ